MERICPQCQKPINDDEALLCLYCGESLQRSVGFLDSLRIRNPKGAFAVIIVILVISFLLLITR